VSSRFAALMDQLEAVQLLVDAAVP